MNNPNILVEVEFDINGFPVTGIYVNEDKDKQDKKINSNYLVATVKNIELTRLLPDDLSAFSQFIPKLTVQEITALICKDSSAKTHYTFHAELGTKINLSNLPLVGKQFSADQAISIEKLRVTARSKTPEKSQLEISSIINLGGVEEKELSIPLVDKPEEKQNTATGDTDGNGSTPAVTKPKNEGMTKWFELNKTMGPVTIQRVGGRYLNNRLDFLLDAQMQLGPLTVSLDGLSVGSSLSKFEPQFNLNGLGLNFTRGAISIQGALLRKDNAYAGVVVIRLPKLTMSVLGAYQEIDGQASLFIYGVLKLSFGAGPPFFQLTGIAAGFGYNRTVRVPAIDRVKQFPLVSAAVGAEANDGKSNDPLQILQNIKMDIPASRGDLFFALGITFSSFKMIDAFALLIVSVGNSNRVDLLGMAKMTVPPLPKTSQKKFVLAQVELALKASYDFDDGSLKVEGQLTPASFIFSPNCHLTGGFAFYSWFTGEHDGDFVYTMGGYHTNYQVPGHYPSVPRLGFHWQLSQDLSLKGGMYYALTPNALMAGGRLQASFDSQFTIKVDLGIAGATLCGRVQASFLIGADFLIAWQPFYYQADLYLSIHVNAAFAGQVKFLFFTKNVQKSFNLNLSAGLSIKGPEFSGRAHISWTIISFDIKFGNQQSPVPALTWNEFKEAFLPEDTAVATLSVTSGLTRTLKKENIKSQNDLQIINPAELELSVDTVIPLTSIKLARVEKVNSTKAINIASMGDASVSSSELTITIVDGENNDVSSQFNVELEPVQKSAPSALWGKSADNKQLNNNKTLLSDMLMGCRIKPAELKVPESLQEKPVSKFSYDVKAKLNAYQWVTELPLTVATTGTIGSTVMHPSVIKQREALLKALELDVDAIQLSNLASNSTEAFLAEPTQWTLPASA